MFRRAVTGAAAAALTISLTAGTAAAADHDHDDPFSEPHAHALLIGLTVDGDDVSIRKCVDLAGGRALRTNNHHDNLHTAGGTDADGRGINVRGIRQAGHAVVPATCTQIFGG